MKELYLQNENFWWVSQFFQYFDLDFASSVQITWNIKGWTSLVSFRWKWSLTVAKLAISAIMQPSLSGEIFEIKDIQK